jgi:hypothetical protein
MDDQIFKFSGGPNGWCYWTHCPDRHDCEAAAPNDLFGCRLRSANWRCPKPHFIYLKKKKTRQWAGVFPASLLYLAMGSPAWPGPKFPGQAWPNHVSRPGLGLIFFGPMLGSDLGCDFMGNRSLARARYWPSFRWRVMNLGSAHLVG